MEILSHKRFNRPTRKPDEIFKAERKRSRQTNFREKSDAAADAGRGNPSEARKNENALINKFAGEPTAPVEIPVK